MANMFKKNIQITIFNMNNACFQKNGLQCRFFYALLLWLFFFLAGPVFRAEADTMQTRYPEFAQGFFKSARLESMDDEMLLRSDSFTISRSELEKAIDYQDPKDRRQLEKNLIFVLEQETIRRVLLNEAKKEGISNIEKNHNQAIQTLLELKTKGLTVSDKEAESFHRANKEMVGEMPFEQVAEVIRYYMLQDKKQKAIEDYIHGLRDSVQLSINEKWVDAQILLALDNPVDKARKSGKPTLVEFGAPGCVPCDMMQPILENLRKNYPEKLNIVFIHADKEKILASRFGVRSIPVQVFYDSQGKEVFRHTGFLPEIEVTQQLSKLGIEK